MNFARDEFGDQPTLGADQGIDVLGILQRRKWIVLFSTLLGLVLGYLYFAQAKPVYQSGAQVLIERNLPPALPISIDQPANRYSMVSDAYKHPVLMTSAKHVVDAIANQQLSKLPSLAASSYPVGLVQSGLRVVPLTEGLGVYNVSYKGPNSEDAGKIVNAIIDEYNRYLEDSHRGVGRDTRSLIVRAKSELLDQLSAKETAYNKFREEAPLIYKDGEGTNLHQERQIMIEEERSRVLLEINNIESQLAAIRDHSNREERPEAILAAAGISDLEALSLGPTAERRLVKKPVVEKTVLLPLLLEEDGLLARYGKDHPKVKAVRRRISSSKDFYLTNYKVDLDRPEMLNVAESEPTSDVKAVSFEQQIADRLQIHVESLQHKLVGLQSTERRLASMFEQEQQSAKAMTQVQMRDQSLRNDISRTQQVYDQVLDKLRDIEVVGEYDGYRFDVLARAGNGYQIAPRATRIIPMAGILGLMAGCLLGYLFDTADKSFHDPVTISQELGLPVIGHVPVIETDKPDPNIPLDPILCTVHHADSPTAEAIRTIRTALFFNASGKSQQVIQVTSGRPGEGKSSVSANLAITIANSGKTCLLIDADFRRPRQQKLFRSNEQQGFAAAIGGTADLQDTIREVAQVPNLSLMTCGKRPKNPAELISSSRFPNALQQLREQFDFVIIDTPPVLAVSETPAIAAQVDGVIFVMRIHKESKPVSQRSLEMLRESGADLVGVVVNGVGTGTTNGKYYAYGGGNYAYKAQKYGYSYTEGYGDS